MEAVKNLPKSRIAGIHVGKPLPPPLLGDKSTLSQKAKSEIVALIGHNPKQFLTQAFLAWGVITAAIAVTLRAHMMLPVYLPAIFIIATRQNLLGLLVHEQAHYLGFRSKSGELVANLLTAYPLLITIDDYAKVHLSHHIFYFTEKDPDYLRKQGKEWIFPLKRRELVKLFLADLSGINTWKTLKGKKMKENYIGQRKTATPKWVRALFYGIMATVFTLVKIWKLFFFFWLIPLITLFQIFIRWGALCEHKYNLINPKIHESTPLIKLKWWEQLLFPNLNFTLHIYHHYFPGISFSKLPKVHRIFQRERLVNELNVFRGYGMFLNYLFRREKSTNDGVSGSSFSSAFIRQN